ncbi:MAG: tRNA pseudouridine(55) synthase TruB [Acidobacteria bacterium]|nr:tRNA pseudouridine(55) synthase TruB [Acidobacteriota bacterium]
MNDGQQTTDHELDGILVIDKPADWTSHDVVAKLRKICRTRRVGHTGTLDPFATGVLVVCLNRATRLVQFLTGEDKEYIATIHFGFATDTGDLTGVPASSPTSTGHLNDSLLANVLQQFRGAITQIPPMYSAKKIGGVKLYEMARRGEEVERQPIAVEIHELELMTPLQNNQCQIRVVCSSGTYIRTLAEDIGKAVGVGAHLVALRRTRAGNCHLAQAHTLESLAAIAEEGRLAEVIVPMAMTLAGPEYLLSLTETEMVLHGRKINQNGQWSSGQQVKLMQQERLMALAEYDAEMQTLQPRVVF